MIKKLHLLLLKSFIGPFIAAFSISIFILLLQFVFKYAEMLVGKGLSYAVIFNFFAYATVQIIPMALPLATLLASLMTFGNLGENYELTAAKSAGISLLRIILPLFIFVSLIAGSAFAFSTLVVPKTNLALLKLRHEISNKRPELSIVPGRFNSEIANYSIKIGAKNNETAMMYNFILHDHSKENGNLNVSYADSATMKITDDNSFMVVTMYDGYSYVEGAEAKQDTIVDTEKQDDHPLRRNKFEKQTAIMELEGYESMKQTDFDNNPYIWNIEQLLFLRDSLYLKYEWRLAIYPERFKKAYFNSIENKDTSLTESNFYTAISTLPKAQKAELLDYAVNTTKDTRIFTERNKGGLLLYRWWAARMGISLNKKISLSFIIIIMFFIGAPLGAIVRKGSFGTPMVISVFFFIFYYVIMLSGEKMIRASILYIEPGIWIPVGIMTLIALFITYKAANDAAILNTEPYRKVFNKLFGKKAKQKA